ncbi:MAG TPA: fatty acid desaturase, partial [Candidatus Binatia bacterium]|nr:fatty acid desaturase [Candidatus Binatia bacterium]
LFLIAPLFVFVVKYRFANAKAGLRECLSVYSTNLALLAMTVTLSVVFGLKAYLILQLIVLGVAASAGVWLFYVQHQFEGVYWERSDEWDYTAAALQGSSFYKLPWLLKWFSGNIGFHHIHHLSARIPNYHLEKCHKAEPLFQTVKPVTFFASFKSFTFRLWDEQKRKLVGYSALRAARKRQKRFGRSSGTASVT